jgi:hypothetical protein
MRKTALFMTLLFFSAAIGPAFSGTDNFLGAPLMPEGKTVLKTKKRLEMLISASHDEVMAFYKEALKDKEDIKFRDWADATYIEDDSNRKWHSITISKEPREGMTHVVIVKDNWTWIIGTLILRYIGVFVVLLCLFAGMSLFGAILSRTSKQETPAK